MYIIHILKCYLYFIYLPTKYTYLEYKDCNPNKEINVICCTDSRECVIYELLLQSFLRVILLIILLASCRHGGENRSW